ncbi:DNA topoisomerase I, partial [Ferroglobus sp.]|uniref:DNA topoisomerase I n=1 Tax=Ferroglobus sp. TaxID=2614230 RepID=UPI0025BDD0E6
EYNDWKRVELTSLLNARIIRVVKEKSIVKLLEELAKESDRVTIATDYDREGELIGLEAVQIIKRVNPNVRIDRVKFSAVTPEEIRKAFSSPGRINVNLAKAAETRQIIDLLWGAVLTRLISLSSGRLGRDFLSAGRVQSPTLRIIVDREKEIREFKPEPYWEISAKFEKGVEAKIPRRFKDKEEAKRVYEKIGDGIVKSFEERERVEKKPIPFNTTEFLKEASKFMPPDKAMAIAENLYINGYISYPRTDNTVYPPSLNLKKLVKMFLDSEFAKEAKIALEDMKPSRGKRETKDHPPIHPTALADRKELSKDEWIIYELVVRRFLATLAPDAVWMVRKAEIISGGEKLVASGKELIKSGWRAIYIYSKAEDVFLPKLRVGERLKLLSKKLHEKKTKPPSRYSTSSLIKLMEKLNLGTKSTRHEIIKKLYSRGYVRGNPVKPTETAFSVVEALKKLYEPITLPDMTAKLEEDMNKIEEGKVDPKFVVKESVEFLRKVLESANREELSKILSEGINKDKIVGSCPECGGNLVVKKAKRRFVACSNYPDCKFSLPLPQKGSLYVTAKTCKEHGMKFVKIKPKKGKSWEFCPYCSYLSWVNR